MIEISQITKSFSGIKVLKGISFTVKKGGIVSIAGASGAGKTTLLQIIGTLSKPDQGTVFINDKNINTLRDKKLAKFRNSEIGFVFQFHHLLPEFTAFENICIPGFIAKKPRQDVEQKAKELLGFLKLEDRAGHKPNELSGGEQQRIAVARALINNPSVILADEPSGNLDSKNKEELHNLFFKLREKFHQTFIIVTHDNSLAKMSDRIITLKDGIIASSGQV
jgi:lipoprotein-releasing system ATP-binding protein